MQSNRLGEILVKNNLINRDQLSNALEEQKLSGNQLRIGSILIFIIMKRRFAGSSLRNSAIAGHRCSIETKRR